LRICDISELDMLVTDSGAADEMVESFEKA
jgi:DeoR/GlpR family transcriptional regulator of sugar metabolism